MANANIDTQELTQEWLDAGYEPESFAQPLNEMPSVNEYIAAGIGPDTHKQWEKMCGFDIDKMQELLQHYELSELETLTVEGLGAYAGTIAYKYCNGDLSLQEIDQILGE